MELEKNKEVKVSGVKNSNLLSFEDEEIEEEGDGDNFDFEFSKPKNKNLPLKKEGGMKSAHEMLNSSKLSKQPVIS